MGSPEPRERVRITREPYRSGIGRTRHGRHDRSTLPESPGCSRGRRSRVDASSTVRRVVDGP